MPSQVQGCRPIRNSGPVTTSGKPQPRVELLAGVAGLFVPVLWFGMDWQGAANKEVAALQSRQQYLATLVL